MKVAIWKSAIDGSPPAMVPCDYGGEPDHQVVMILGTVLLEQICTPVYSKDDSVVTLQVLKSKSNQICSKCV